MNAPVSFPTPVALTTAANWHEAPRAAGILATILLLHDAAIHMPERIGPDLNDARSRIGWLEWREVGAGFGQAWTRQLHPSHGCTHIDELWTELGNERAAAMTAQVAAEGFDPDSDEAFERLWSLQDTTPTVQAVVAGGLSNKGE